MCNWGEDYYIVISNKAGLFRYIIGDVIRVIGFKKQVPILQFVSRKDDFYSIYNERMSLGVFTKALQKVLEHFGVDKHKIEFTLVFYDKVYEGKPGDPLSYTIFLEIPKTMDTEQRGEFENKLDAQLQKDHLGYQHFRVTKLKKIKGLFCQIWYI
jgi:hypothetical protein